MLLATSLVASLAALPHPGIPVPTGPIKLSDAFQRVKTPMTNRTAVLVTEGADASYPFYYFAPSITKNGRYLIYHRYSRNTTKPPAPPPGPPGWYTADGYDAILGLDYEHDQPGVLHRVGTTPTAPACQQACAGNSTCGIWVWSKSSTNCYMRLDGQWGAASTIGPTPSAVSGCLRPNVTGCGSNPAAWARGDAEVQLWRVDLTTAEHTQLTFATGVNTSWVPWQQEPGLRGILDYRGALNTERNLVVYFDGRAAHAVDLDTLADRVLFTLDPGREAIAQNSVSPDGRFFYFIDAEASATYSKPNVTGTRLTSYSFDTGELHVFAVIDHACHHILPFDNRYVIVNHPPPGSHSGMVWADATNGNCTTATRNCGWVEIYGSANPPYDPGDPNETAHSCHQVSTPTGVWYEATGRDGQVSGVYDPLTRSRFEWRLPADFGYSHTGLDPAGRLGFWETVSPKYGHCLFYLDSVDAGGAVVKPLVGPWPNSAAMQRGHFHPQLTSDRQWVLMTGADAQKRAQVAFVDVSDVTSGPASRGVSDAQLSHSGANDVSAPGHIEGVPDGHVGSVRLTLDERAEVADFLAGKPQID